LLKSFLRKSGDESLGKVVEMKLEMKLERR
jgi:hypothetical protein